MNSVTHDIKYRLSILSPCVLLFLAGFREAVPKLQSQVQQIPLASSRLEISQTFLDTFLQTV